MINSVLKPQESPRLHCPKIFNKVAFLGADPTNTSSGKQIEKTAKPKNDQPKSTKNQVKKVPDYLYGAAVEGANDLDKYWAKREKERVVLSNSPRVKKLARTAARKSAVRELPPTDEDSESSTESVFSGADDKTSEQISPKDKKLTNGNTGPVREKVIVTGKRINNIGPSLLINTKDERPRRILNCVETLQSALHSVDSVPTTKIVQLRCDLNYIFGKEAEPSDKSADFLDIFLRRLGQVESSLRNDIGVIHANVNKLDENTRIILSKALEESNSRVLSKVGTDNQSLETKVTDVLDKTTDMFEETKSWVSGHKTEMEGLVSKLVLKAKNDLTATINKMKSETSHFKVVRYPTMYVPIETVAARNLITIAFRCLAPEVLIFLQDFEKINLQQTDLIETSFGKALKKLVSDKDMRPRMNLTERVNTILHNLRILNSDMMFPTLMSKTTLLKVVTNLNYHAQFFFWSVGINPETARFAIATGDLLDKLVEPGDLTYRDLFARVTKIFADNKILVAPGYQPVQDNGDPWFFDLKIPVAIPLGNMFKEVDKNQISQITPITDMVTKQITAEPQTNPSVVELQRTMDNSIDSQEHDSFISNENSQENDQEDDLRPVLNSDQYDNLSSTPELFLDYISK